MAIRTLHDVLKEISSHDGYFHEEDLGPDGLVSVNARGVAGDTPLHVAAWADDTADAAILLSAGADPNIAGDMDETPLHVAVRRGNVALIMLLLKAGADPDVISEFEESPAGMAAEMGGLVAEAFVRTA